MKLKRYKLTKKNLDKTVRNICKWKSRVSSNGICWHGDTVRKNKQQAFKVGEMQKGAGS